MATKKTKRPASKKTKRSIGPINCAERMRAFIQRLDDEPLFDSVDIDVEPEAEDEWGPDYAIAAFTAVPSNEEFFDGDECQRAFMRECVSSLRWNVDEPIAIKVGTYGHPGRPWKVGEYALLFHNEEVEFYRLTKESVASLVAEEKRLEDCRKKALAS